MQNVCLIINGVKICIPVIYNFILISICNLHTYCSSYNSFSQCLWLMQYHSMDIQWGSMGWNVKWNEIKCRMNEVWSKMTRLAVDWLSSLLRQGWYIWRTKGILQTLKISEQLKLWKRDEKAAALVILYLRKCCLCMLTHWSYTHIGCYRIHALGEETRQQVLPKRTLEHYWSNSCAMIVILWLGKN